MKTKTTKREIKKAVKAVRAAKPLTVGVSRPIPTAPVTVLGIDFEQGDTYRFGKCIMTGAPNRVWNFILFDGEYILFSRHPQDRMMDVSHLTEAMFLLSYQIVDFDTPTITGGPGQVAPQPVAAGLGQMNVGPARGW